MLQLTEISQLKIK